MRAQLGAFVSTLKHIMIEKGGDIQKKIGDGWPHQTLN